jgi:predicted lipoprotein with Yx(FWY)xxD motif
MNRLAILTVTAGALAAAAAGCSSSGNSSSSGAGGAGAVTVTSGGAAVVKTASSPLGQILVDGSGRTLYLYKPDTGMTSTCTGSCASIWPPDATTGKPQGTGVSASMLGTTTRSDKSSQVTFDGHPLYYFSGDSKAGDVKGQGYQGIWFVVSPSGTAITSAPAPSSSSTGGSGGGYGY